MIPIYIGYDPREAIAYHVCTNSIIKYASQPVCFIPVALNLLPNYIETHTDGSNQFSYSRFLVPELQNYQGWAIYIDCDTIVTTDITELWNLQNNDYAVMCVQHNYQSSASIKYLNSINTNYPRKNWSSVILWNCNHKLNQLLSSTTIVDCTGSYLHRFSWLPDSLIGEIPIEWNWLPDEYGHNDAAKLIHYTLGIPEFNEYADTPMADKWNTEKYDALYCKQLDI